MQSLFSGCYPNPTTCGYCKAKRLLLICSARITSIARIGIELSALPYRGVGFGSLPQSSAASPTRFLRNSNLISSLVHWPIIHRHTMPLQGQQFETSWRAGDSVSLQKTVQFPSSTYRDQARCENAKTFEIVGHAIFHSSD